MPIDAVTSTVDHFIPGIAVDRVTSGATARIGLTYYYYPTASCTASTCQLDAGFISSVNGGSTWSAATQLAGPMNLSWLPNTSAGPDVRRLHLHGDRRRRQRLSRHCRSRNAPTGSTFDLAMYVPTGGLAVTGGTRAASAAHSHRFTPQPAPTLPVTAH